MHKFNIKNIEKLDNPKRRESMPPEETLNKFKIGSKGTLLDIGCGTGYFTIPATRILKDGNAIGIDIVPEMLEIAKEKGKNIQNLEFRKTQEYTFPIETQSIEYAFISNVIHEIQDKVKYFNEIKRVLKNDGFLYIIDWDKREMEVGPDVNERISKEEIKDLCTSVNIAFVEEIDINPEHYGLKFKYNY